MITAQNVRIDHEKCMGCKACANACPISVFRFQDEGGVRTFSFETVCSEDCRLCENTCSANAIKLAPGADKESMQIVKFDFLMIHCSSCLKIFDTQRMAEKVHRSLSKRLKDLKPDWVTLCPDCKKQREVVKIVGNKAEYH